jgi:sialidase-1
MAVGRAGPALESDMGGITEVSHHTIFKHPAHCVNQIAARVVAGGDIVAVFNEERFPYHHDSGQTLLVRSKDGGKSWSEPTIVLPWTATTGNWDCGFADESVSTDRSNRSLDSSSAWGGVS